MAKKPVPRSVESLKKLLSQINAHAPNRNKASDGWIGDAKHAARHSDHNPEPDGTVDARDFTNDPSGGLDIQRLCDALVESRDPRISYIICNGKIISGRKGPKPWVPRKYNGSNGHYHHIHVSVLDEGQDDKSPWQIESAFRGPVTSKQADSVMHLGSQGEFVKDLQKDLVVLGYPVSVDGHFGKETETQVIRFQKDHGLLADGWAGPRTLATVGNELSKRKLQPKIEAAENKAEVAQTKADKAEIKVEVAKKVVEDAADDKGLTSTEVLTGITGFTAISATVKQIVDVVKESTESVTSLLSLGPWVLLGVVSAAAAGYVIYNRRKLRLEAEAVKKVI